MVLQRCGGQPDGVAVPDARRDPLPFRVLASGRFGDRRGRRLKFCRVGGRHCHMRIQLRASAHACHHAASVQAVAERDGSVIASAARQGRQAWAVQIQDVTQL